MDRNKEDFGKLMIHAELSDHEFVILAKRLGLDGKPLSIRALAKMFGFDESLTKTIYNRALNRVRTNSEDQGEFQYLFEKITEGTNLCLK